jgi:hypothetical protein
MGYEPIVPAWADEELGRLDAARDARTAGFRASCRRGAPKRRALERGYEMTPAGE